MKNHKHHVSNHSKNALLFAIFATTAIFVVEVIGAFWTNSLALLSDSAHVFMDVFSFILTLSALELAQRNASDRRTYGWHRAEVFAALINALSVLAIGIIILVHGFKRIIHPQQIKSEEMLVIALVGLVVNLLVIWKLRPHVHHDVNLRSAFLHAFGDALASIAVVAGGILVLATKKPVFDPIIALIVSLIILVNGYRVLADSIHILMEGTPEGIERQNIIRAIEEISGKQSVKDLHIWSLCSHMCALSVHIVLDETQLHHQKHILREVSKALENKFSILHSTIQIEFNNWHEPRTEPLQKEGGGPAF